MKKTFKLTHKKIKPERLVDAIRNEVRKYIKRERKKSWPMVLTIWISAAALVLMRHAVR